MFGRNKIAQLVAEFLGAATLSLAVYTIMARTSFPLFSAMAAGIVVALFTLIMGAVSGAHLNPAITLGLWTVRKIQTTKAVVYIAAQMLGGVAAWYLLKYFLGHNLQSIAGADFEWKVFTAEAVGAGLFGFGYLAAKAQQVEEGKVASAIGAALLTGILVASLASNAVLNPAVAVGIQSWSWAYAAAPLAGALVGMNVYQLLFTTTPLAAVASSSVTTKKVVASKKKKTTRRKK